MSGRRALLALAVLPLWPAAAAADEAIARRLAALESLARPEAALAARRARPPSDTCGSAWWRMSEYGLRARIDAAVRDASLRYGVEARLVRAVIRHESNFDPDAVSHKGAMGLMQLMPGTARELGVVCPHEPRENVLAGTRYLRRMYEHFGRWPQALAAYNAGPQRVARGSIPAETRRYVARIMASWRPRRSYRLDL